VGEVDDLVSCLNFFLSCLNVSSVLEALQPVHHAWAASRLFDACVAKQLV
jgi:hypothetical protein